MRWGCLLAVIEGRLDDAERLAHENVALMTQLGDPDAEHLRIALLVPIRPGRAGSTSTVRRSPSASPAHPSRSRGARCCAPSTPAPDGPSTCERSSPMTARRSRTTRTGSPPSRCSRTPASTRATRRPRRRCYRLLEPYAGYLPGFLYGSGQLGPVALRLGRLARLLGRPAEAHFEHARAIAERIPAPLWLAARV